MARFTAIAPGRVNLIGDHTDYTGGLVLPLAIDRWTTIEGERTDGTIALVSDADSTPLHLALPVDEPGRIAPEWGRYVAGVAAEMRAERGLIGQVTSTIPIGAGLSSSAALEIATALALGFDGDRTELALLCQRAEHRASGVPCGIMDQLCIASAVHDHAVLIDCHDLTVTPVAIPADCAVVITFVAPRRLAGSEYADRVRECRTAEVEIGPLRLATLDDVATIDDAVVASRARHVVTENDRVRRTVDALRADRPDVAGRLMTESHVSLATDYATSTPAMDRAVSDLAGRDGVFGARMTGGGFGGCVVALVESARAPAVADAVGGWLVRAVGAAVVR
jgi:galactokinase